MRTKEQHAAYMREWRQKHPEWKEYMRQYRLTNKERINKKDKEYGRLHPEGKRRCNKRYKVKYKYKKNAQQWAERNIPLASECELCPEDDKRKENLQRHHPDYNYKHIVVTVCHDCHECLKETQEVVL